MRRQPIDAALAGLGIDQAARKPACRVAQMVATGKLEAIAGAPFDS